MDRWMTRGWWMDGRRAMEGVKMEGGVHEAWMEDG